MKISGNKAVVFGGTSGIGLAIVRMLAQEGASVVAISRDPTKSGPLPTRVTTGSAMYVIAPPSKHFLTKLA